MANNIHLQEETVTTEVPTWIGHTPSEPAHVAQSRPRVPRGPDLRRVLLLVGTGVVVGLVLLVGVVVLGMRSLNSGGLAAQTPAVAGAQVSTPQRAATSAATVRPTVAPTAALPPTAGARPPAPTAAPQPGALATGAALLDVRFVSGAGQGWLDNPPFAGWTDGAYRLQASQPARFVAVGSPSASLPSDIVVSGTFRKTGGPPGGGYGLIIRDQGPSPRDGVNQTMYAYVLETGDLGEFGIWRRDGDHWVDLMPWMRSSSVRPGGSPNELSVRAIGDRMTFVINGTQVASVQDNALPTGGVGVFVGGDYNEVALDRFTVQVPD
jgi:hypothetical protein